MSDTATGFYAEHRPTIWQRLGFRQKHDVALFEWRIQDAADGFVGGTMNTSTHVILDWKDRLRLLVTGHALIDVYTRTDVMPKRLESRSQFCVLPPYRSALEPTPPTGREGA